MCSCIHCLHLHARYRRGHILWRLQSSLLQQEVSPAPRTAASADGNSEEYCASPASSRLTRGSQSQTNNVLTFEVENKIRHLSAVCKGRLQVRVVEGCDASGNGCVSPPERPLPSLESGAALSLQPMSCSTWRRVLGSTSSEWSKAFNRNLQGNRARALAAVGASEPAYHGATETAFASIIPRSISLTVFQGRFVLFSVMSQATSIR